VKWKCKISRDIRFTDETIDAIEFASEKFERPGYLDYVQLRHPFYSPTTSFEDNIGEELAQ
jgi:hypothetical protein